MGKTYRRFRDQWANDEWNDFDEDNERKKSKLKKRRDQQKKRTDEKFANIEDTFDDDE
jgi:Sec-independent protein translocase protein TatA